MSFRQRKLNFFTLILLTVLLSLPHSISSLSPAPADHLVPPPLPETNPVATRFKHTGSPTLQLSESRTVPKLVYPQLPAKTKEKHPGIMTRVARWFGFANQNALTDQQVSAGTNKEPYYYHKPSQQQQQYGKGDKAHCYLCNKYPWVPIMPNSIQYPENGAQWDAFKQTQLYSSPQLQHASSNVKQRAIKFNFPLPYVPPPAMVKAPDIPNHIQYSTGPFLPIPVPPLLSNSALPPLYNAQNFLAPITPVPIAVQELPSTKPAHFSENIAEHSEIHLDTVIPTQIPPTIPNSDASFEIVKSHQLVDYVSSVEYPASYEPSHVYDVSTQATVLAKDTDTTKPTINAGFYQHSTFTPYLSQHIPASQILTEPGNFVVANQQQSNSYEQTTAYNQPEILRNTQHYEEDNYVAASHHNSSVFRKQHQQQPTSLDAWTLESNNYVYSTSTPQAFSTVADTSTFTTELEGTTQPQAQDNEIELIASIQTSAQHANVEAEKVWPQKSKQRETPKRLLDSPIQHVNGNLGAPRPFTRDPSDLTFRLSPVNHKIPDMQHAVHEERKSKSTTTVPTTSSTYSSIDASGQYAGISLPSLPSTYNNEQIFLPYLSTKNRPRPFESTRISEPTKPPSTWSQAQNIEIHTPQESMLVKSHIKPAVSATTTTAKPHTTKYLTKILASNLRELLQREHEPTKLRHSPNSLDIDINKLQKNIDDWTEQEYTSLSHRPSTPTIRGRSKNIPSEYLPTTKSGVNATRQSKTTKIFANNSELPSSINNLEPLSDRDNTKHSQYTQITDNYLTDIYTNFESMKSNFKTTTTTTTTTPSTPTTTMSSSTTTTTTEKTLYLKPIQIQEPAELWKKAEVSISPKTQEKVYVVTPQPRFSPQRYYSSTVASISTTTTTAKPMSSSSWGNVFKSPRFLVRPTPGNDTPTKENSEEMMKNSFLTPEWFGLKGLSAYVPSEPVEIIDGNSKVLNIVTAPSNLEKTTRHNIMDLTKDRHTDSRRKTTMAPRPR